MNRVDEQKMVDELLSKIALDPAQIQVISKRLRRANGQLGAVVRMLDEGRTCEEIVTQLAAVGKAINTAAFTLISANLTGYLASEKSNSAEVTEKLQKLFLSLA